MTMLKKALQAAALGILLGASGGDLIAQAPPPAAPRAVATKLKVGDTAPDFTLPGTDGKTYRLSEFRGQKNVVLAFYVLAFTGG